MEQAMLSAQAANTNRIRELERQVASVNTELQKVRQQLTTAHYNKPHGKSADKANPAAPPATPHATTPAARRPQKPLDIWGNPTENMTWAERLNASVNQQDKPFMTITHKNKKPVPTTIIPKALPRIERDVIITCETRIIGEIDRTNFANYALNRFNHIIKHSPEITLPPFILARINSNSKLVLTTNPTTPATTYASYLQMLSADIKPLQPMDPQINGRWSKFLVHNVPTNAKLPAIKAEIETTYPSLRLAQDPRWLVPEECRLNKTSSTLVVSLIGTIDLQHLGTTSLAICNCRCRINVYFSWTPASHCNHCQGYGHHTQLCKANKPTCAVCAQQHAMRDHYYPISTCHAGGTCIHPPFKCACCSAAHKANDPVCPVRIKYLTDLRNAAEPTPQDETMEPQV
jgi:ribosomal protein L29